MNARDSIRGSGFNRDPGGSGFSRDPGGSSFSRDPGGSGFSRDFGGGSFSRDPGGSGFSRAPGGSGFSRDSRRRFAPIALLTLAALGAAGACAQDDFEIAVGDDVPRTADGKPDLSGIWIATGAIALFEGPEALEAAREADAAAGRTLPRNEPPPYQPEAEGRRQEYLARQGIDDPMARCLLTGVPRIKFRPLPFEIVQLPDRVIILYEIHHAFRIIPTDGRPHPEDLEPSYLGDSVGRWEGDTFVVDVVGFNDNTWLQGVGTIHSEQLRVTERYTRDSVDTIVYEAVMEDPEVFTEPWRLREIFRRRPNERIREYECIESNEDMLRFERLLESEEEAFRLP